MTLSLGDRAFETSTTQGTIALNLDGPVLGFVSLVAAVGSGKIVPYIISDNEDWETGYGTITAGTPDTLTRNPIRSSNANAAVNWGPGTRNVRLGLPASFTVSRDQNLNLVEGFGTGGGTANAHTVALPVTPLGWSDGMTISYFSTVENTGALGITVTGLGGKTAKINGLDVPPKFVKVGSFVQGTYRAASNTIELTSPGVATHPGVAKAWVKFNGTGTPAILDSFNVASITDNGVGDYSINFINPMPSANYVAIGSAIGSASLVTPSIYSTGAVRINASNSTSGVLDDLNEISVTVFSN